MALKTLIEAVNEALHEEMERDPSMIVLGEDVGVHGGVFRATDGLQKRFGADRVIDTPLAELGIVGSGLFPRFVPARIPPGPGHRSQPRQDDEPSEWVPTVVDACQLVVEAP